MESASMGIVYADIELTNGDDLAFFRRGHFSEEQIHRCSVRAMVDSGATMLAIPELIQKQLDLQPITQLEAALADGSASMFEVVAPVEVRFQNRRTSVDALVVPGSDVVLLGAIPMEGMDVLINPKRERLIVNSESPDVARMLLM